MTNIRLVRGATMGAATAAPDKDLVDMLEKLTARARIGEVVAVALVAEPADDRAEPDLFFIGDIDPYRMHGLVASLGLWILEDDDDDE